MRKLQYFLEKQAFGVCNKIGSKMDIPTATIRMYFIYASFLTFGSPILLYLGIAFWMNFRYHLRKSRNPVWYY